MGNNETEVTSKPAKVSPLQQEQVAVHSYPDWSAMQAYYGPGVGIPAPYFASAVIPGHAHHPCMWGPQHMMPPFGTPYPAIYAHGGYPHPSVTHSPHARSQGNTSFTGEAVTATVRIETYDKPEDCGLMKKLKGFNGLAVSTNNGDSGNKGGFLNGLSQSEEDCGGSSDGSEDISQGSPTLGKRGPSVDPSSRGKKAKEKTVSSTEDASPAMSLGVAVGHPTVVRNTVGVTPPLGKPSVDLGVSIKGNPETIGASPLSSAPTLPIREPWMQDERELKRERRKQSNRESARRSRLRKQSETEELALKVETLSSEKASLESEMSRLSEMSEKLREENSILLEKLKILEGGEPNAILGEVDSRKSSSIGFENLLSRLDKSDPSIMDGQLEPETHDSSKVKLHQLLEPNPRTDTVNTS